MAMVTNLQLHITYQISVSMTYPQQLHDRCISNRTT